MEKTRTALPLHLSLAVVFFVLNSCGKEKIIAAINTPTVSGYLERDGLGNLMNVEVGSPNVQLSDGADYLNSNYFLAAYPNPCTADRFSLIIKFPQGNTPAKLWIVSANWSNIKPVTETHPTEGTLNLTAKFKAESTSKVMVIDASNFTKGYYRIYMKADNKLFYDNLHIK